MTENDRLQARGRMEELDEAIRASAMLRFTMLRALRERLDRALPAGMVEPTGPLLPLDFGNAAIELAWARHGDEALSEAVDEYNRLAAALALPGLKRRAY